MNRIIKHKDLQSPTVPVTLAQMKEFLQIPMQDTFDNVLIQAAINAAFELSEKKTNRLLSARNVAFYADKFEPNFWLFGSPINSITSIQYYDAQNQLQTLPETDYYLDNAATPSRVKITPNMPATFDRPNAVIITCNAGYQTTPEALKVAIKLQAANIYEFREDKSIEAPLNRASELILNQFSDYYI